MNPSFDVRGTVFDIQRYSIHDGPGIRTTIFLKGCPLSCKWCSNPESQNLWPELLVKKERCNQCGKCLKICPLGAITLEEGIQIDKGRCDLCLKCTDVCPTNAISCVGQNITIEKVMDEIGKDELFYRNSAGGVTISGGEPLFQPEFTLALLKVCKARSLNTALDTTGYAKWEVFDEILEYTDLVLFDIKHLDSDVHREATGVGNELILGNLERCAKKGARIWIRVPVIPSYNDSEEYIRRLAEFLLGIPAEKVSLLGYHELGRKKYDALGRNYSCNGLSPLSNEKLYSLKNIMESYGLKVTIGY